MERKTREFMIVKLPDKSAKSVMAAFETLLDEIQRTLRSGLHNNYDGQWFRVCDLSNLEKAAETLYTMRIPTPRAIKAP